MRIVLVAAAMSIAVFVAIWFGFIGMEHYTNAPEEFRVGKLAVQLGFNRGMVCWVTRWQDRRGVIMERHQWTWRQRPQTYQILWYYSFENNLPPQAPPAP
jgi:hypothetical protein